MSEQQETFRFDGWAIIEMLGHRKRAGKVRTAELGGNAVFVVETPTEAETFLTEVYAAGSLYALTPVSEEAARLAARHINPEPIGRWDLPANVRAALERVEREEREKLAAIDAGDSGATSETDDVPFGFGREAYEADHDDIDL